MLPLPHRRSFCTGVASGLFALFSSLVMAAPPGSITLTAGRIEAAPACDPLKQTIDVDFRIADFQGDGSWNNVSLAAAEGSIAIGQCGNASGFYGAGVNDGNPDNPNIQKSEALLVDFSGAGGNGAFDVTGMFAGNMVSSGNGETCAVTLTLIDDSEQTFVFSRKNPLNTQSPGPNPNNEFFVPFVDTTRADAQPLRITAARVTATSGDCSVIGFTNNPVYFAEGNCKQGQPVTANCSAQLAQGISLEIENTIGNLIGTLYKQGVVIALDDRPFCLGQAAVPEILPVDLNGDGTPDVAIPETHCGIPDALGNPEIHFLILDSEVEIEADGIQMLFEDGDAQELGFVCTSDDPAKRPQILHVPNNMVANPGNDYYRMPAGVEEMPYLAPYPLPYGSGYVDTVAVDVDGQAVQVPLTREITIGPCGSTRGYRDPSVFVSHVRHALPPDTYSAGDPLDASISAFYRDLFILSLDRLEQNVNTVFACIDRYGTAQSTLQYYLSHIRENFSKDKYVDAAAYLQGFLARIKDPTSQLYDELLVCYYDLDFDFSLGPVTASVTPYVDEDDNPTFGDPLIPANVIGHLQADLLHMLWLIYSGTGMYPPAGAPGTVPSTACELPYFGAPSSGPGPDCQAPQ